MQIISHSYNFFSTFLIPNSRYVTNTTHCLYRRVWFRANIVIADGKEDNIS